MYGGISMARPTKQGVDYFPLDVGFFSDVKIRKIARACGPNSASIILCLLCNIYKDEGYYILWDEDLPFVIADEVGVAEGSVKEVLLKAIQVGLFDNDLYEKYKILTSAGVPPRCRQAPEVNRQAINRKVLIIKTAGSRFALQSSKLAIFRVRHKHPVRIDRAG